MCKAKTQRASGKKITCSIPKDAHPIQVQVACVIVSVSHPSANAKLIASECILVSRWKRDQRMSMEKDVRDRRANAFLFLGGKGIRE